MSRMTFVLVLAVILAATGCGGFAGPRGTPPPGGGGTVTVTLGPGVAWAAYQDGNGPWQRFSGSSFQVTDSAGRYGFAYVCVIGRDQVAQVTVTQATVAELRTLGAACEGDTPPPTAYHVTGTVSNVGTGDSRAAVITVSDFDGGLPDGASFDLFPTVAGVRDLLGLRYPSPGACPDRILVRRGLMVNGDVSGQNLDFAGGSGFSPRAFTVSGATVGRTTSASQNVLTKNATGFIVCGISTPTGQWQAVDSGVIAEDLYIFVVSAESGAGGPGEVALKYVSAVPDPGNQGVTLPAPITGLSATGRRPLYSGLAYVSTTLPLRAYLLFHWQPGSEWSILVTPGWLGGASQYQTPDFSAVAGWNTAWEMEAGRQITWFGRVYLSNRGLAEQPPRVLAGRQVFSQVRARLAQTGRVLARPVGRAGPASVQPGTEVQWAESGEGRYTP